MRSIVLLISCIVLLVSGTSIINNNDARPSTPSWPAGDLYFAISGMFSGYYSLKQQKVMYTAAITNDENDTYGWDTVLLDYVTGIVTSWENGAPTPDLTYCIKSIFDDGPLTDALSLFIGTVFEFVGPAEINGAKVYNWSIPYDNQSFTFPFYYDTVSDRTPYAVYDNQADVYLFSSFRKYSNLIPSSVFSVPANVTCLLETD